MTGGGPPLPSFVSVRVASGPGWVEFRCATQSVLARQLWRLGGALIGFAIAAVGYFLSTTWWIQAIAALFGIVGVSMLIRFLVAVLITPLMTPLSAIRVSFVGTPGVTFLTSFVPLHEIHSLTFDPQGNVVHLRRHDGRLERLPDVFRDEPSGGGGAFVEWLTRLLPTAAWPAHGPGR